MQRDQCKRCGHQWYRRRPEEPVQCPKCKNSYWNRDYVDRSAKREMAVAASIVPPVDFTDALRKLAREPDILIAVAADPEEVEPGVPNG